MDPCESDKLQAHTPLYVRIKLKQHVWMISQSSTTKDEFRNILLAFYMRVSTRIWKCLVLSACPHLHSQKLAKEDKSIWPVLQNTAYEKLKKCIIHNMCGSYHLIQCHLFFWPRCSWVKYCSRMIYSNYYCLRVCKLHKNINLFFTSSIKECTWAHRGCT